MEPYTVNALICLKDDLGFEYVVSEIEYELWENDTFEYRFRPNYSVIELLDSSVFQGIPGIDLELRRKEYVRRNSIPTFVAERAPSSNREDLWRLLEDCGMNYLNQLEWLIKTDTKYIGDRLYVRRPLDGEKVRNLDGEIAKLKRSCDVQRKLLENICLGLTVEFERFVIDDRNRKSCYDLLYRLYKRESGNIKKLQSEGIAAAKKNGKYHGRKAIQVDDTKLYEVCRKYRNHQITLDEAAKLLNMSTSTFYRRIKSLKTD
ncbi:MAG: recombinase family protein [Clostridia bacterium]|nr:recombinase family protein [Clostridia bacterium]